MISVDLDSTLNTLIYDWVEHINTKEERQYNISDIKSFNEPILLKHIDYIENPELYSLLGLLEGAIEFIKELQKIDDVQIVSVTQDHHLKSKGEFVETHFPGVPLINVRDCKLEFTRDSWLIDDKLDNIKKHIAAGNGRGIVFTNGDYQYNNEGDYTVMGDYKEIVKHIKEMNGVEV